MWPSAWLWKPQLVSGTERRSYPVCATARPKYCLAAKKSGLLGELLVADVETWAGNLRQNLEPDLGLSCGGPKFADVVG